MKRELTLTYTVTSTICIDCPDLAHTPEEIDRLVEKAVAAAVPAGVEYDDWDVEWDSARPKAKGEQPLPTDCDWMDVSGFRIATNGHLILLEGCTVEFKNTGNWYAASPALAKKLESVLKWSAIGPHPGWFSNAFKEFDLKTVSAMATDSHLDPAQSIAMILDQGRLIALIAPVLVEPMNAESPLDCFRFNQKATRITAT